MDLKKIAFFNFTNLIKFIYFLTLYANNEKKLFFKNIFYEKIR